MATPCACSSVLCAIKLLLVLTSLLRWGKGTMDANLHLWVIAVLQLVRAWQLQGTRQQHLGCGAVLL